MSLSPIIAPPLAGTVVGSLGTNFVIAEWKDAGGPHEPPRWIAPLHRHHKDGSSVFVPRGTVHTYWNASPGLLRYLLVMTANIYSLIQDIHATTDRSPAALRAVFEKHDSELVEP
jgi:hypothetical protein